MSWLQALHGEVTADVGQAEGGPALPEEIAQRDLIEIYSPVRDRDSGQVIAAAEFYYATDDLGGDIAAAQWRSWMVVGGATLLIYLLLATFIHRVSNTIRRQQQALTAQVTQLQDVIQQNQDLHERVRGAAARTAALNERVLRRLSAELHDGPAQEISLSLLRLDHVASLSGAERIEQRDPGRIGTGAGAHPEQLAPLAARGAGDVQRPAPAPTGDAERGPNPRSRHSWSPAADGRAGEHDSRRSAGSGVAPDQDRPLPHRARSAQQRLASCGRRYANRHRHEGWRSAAGRSG